MPRLEFCHRLLDVVWEIRDAGIVLPPRPRGGLGRGVPALPLGDPEFRLFYDLPLTACPGQVAGVLWWVYCGVGFQPAAGRRLEACTTIVHRATLSCRPRLGFPNPRQ